MPETPEYELVRAKLVFAAVAWRKRIRSNPNMDDEDFDVIEAVDAYLAVANRPLPVHEPKPYPGIWAGIRERLDGLPVEPAVADEPAVEPCPLECRCDDDEPCCCWCDLHDVRLDECPSYQAVVAGFRELEKAVEARVRAELADEPDPTPGEQRLAGAVQHAQTEPEPGWVRTIDLSSPPSPRSTCRPLGCACAGGLGYCDGDL